MTNDSLSRAIAACPFCDNDPRVTNRECCGPLAKAIAYLGAVEVAPGRYAYEVGGAWHTAAAVDLAKLGLSIAANGEPRANVDWLQKVVTMPAWWSPQQRFAWREMLPAFKGAARVKPGGLRLISNPGLDDNNRERLVLPRWQRITASLETGEEVSA